MIRIIEYSDEYRDDMIFMILQAKDALRVIPRINPDLLDIKANYQGNGGIKFWIAIANYNQVVGCIGYKRINNTDEAFIHRFYVKSNMKRMGIGTLLLAKAEDEMIADNISVSKVHTGLSKNVWFESYYFYNKHGYIEYEPRYLKKKINFTAEK